MCDARAPREDREAIGRSQNARKRAQNARNICDLVWCRCERLWHRACPYTLRNHFSIERRERRRKPCRENPVSIDNNFEFVTALSSQLADVGGWFFHVLTVIWGS
jgi:hypothetical protein